MADQTKQPEDRRTIQEKLGNFTFCADAIRRARPFAAKAGESRRYLQGVYLEGDRAVATDGHRLANVKAVSIGDNPPKEGVIVVVTGVIPTWATVAEFKFADGYSGLVTFMGWPKTSKRRWSRDEPHLRYAMFTVVDQTFPNYKQIIPDAPSEARKRFHFNPRYLAETTHVFGDGVVIEGNDSNTPFLVTPGSRKQQDDRLAGDYMVIMPMRPDGWWEEGE